MVQNTAQGEAMHAVRLLRGHALSGELTQAQIEALYQASKLLEGFIEGKSVLAPPSYEPLPISSYQEDLRGIRSFTVHGASFHVGEHVYYTGMKAARIKSITKDEGRMVLHLDVADVNGIPLFWERSILTLNPNGSV